MTVIQKSRYAKIAKIGFVGTACFLPNISWAFSLGELADNIYAPTAFVTKFVIFGCYAVAIALALTGIMQIKNHQQNPKLVPLSTPITLFILSGILLILPYISKQGGGSWSAVEKTKQEEKIVTPNSSPFSGSAAPTESNIPNAPNVPTEPQPAETESGHWGTKPEYHHH